MSNFTKWLVDKGYTTSEDKDIIESEISGPEEAEDALIDKLIEIVKQK
jgi:hypothetical protein